MTEEIDIRSEVLRRGIRAITVVHGCTAQDLYMHLLSGEVGFSTWRRVYSGSARVSDATEAKVLRALGVKDRDELMRLTSRVEELEQKTRALAWLQLGGSPTGAR